MVYISSNRSEASRDVLVAAAPSEHHHHHHHHLSLKHEGRWGTTDDFATSFLHFPLFSTALWDLANSRLVHFLMLSSHLFFFLLCLLPPFTVPSKMVLARPDKRETRPYHFILRLFPMVRSGKAYLLLEKYKVETELIKSQVKVELPDLIMHRAKSN